MSKSNPPEVTDAPEFVAPAPTAAPAPSPTALGTSFLMPLFARRLADPAIKTVMICGCGGGFDFMHGQALYPEMKRLGKKIVIASYSFGNPMLIKGDAPIVFAEGKAVAKLVSSASEAHPQYGPEVHLCTFLDQKYPEEKPHRAYAFYARSFTVAMLTRLYKQIIAEHSVGAIILVDGGSDSLMVGDEQGLGDPIEDAVSVATVASIEGLKLRVLVAMGVGCDRYNSVSDAATMRAIASLTRSGGFMGCLSMEPESETFLFYKQLIEHTYGSQKFHSVISGSIMAATEGWFGANEVPPSLQERVGRGHLYLWPLMAMFWAFDVAAVARRSLTCRLVRDAQTVDEAHFRLHEARSKSRTIREVEELPRHAEFSADGGVGVHYR